METQLSFSARTELDRFCRQYLQLSEPDYPMDENLRSELFQETLYERLFKEDAILHAPPPRYQLRILKELMKRIESSVQDWEEEGISDDLMNYLSSLLVSPIPSEMTAVQQKSYVTFTLSSFPSEVEVPSITLLESRNLIAAAGTTGLRTWEAAFHLGNYLCENASVVEGKRVLELGAGTGYVSLVCAKLGAEHVLSTDGSEDVVAGLETSFYLNGLQDATSIEAKELKWGHALIGSEHPKWNGGERIDIVLGADVTYDGSGILVLLSTFGDLFDLFPDVKIIIAATVRNSVTFDKFLDSCSLHKFTTEEVEFGIKPPAEQNGPFFSDAVPIRICVVSRPRV